MSSEHICTYITQVKAKYPDRLWRELHLAINVCLGTFDKDAMPLPDARLLFRAFLAPQAHLLPIEWRTLCRTFVANDKFATLAMSSAAFISLGYLMSTCTDENVHDEDPLLTRASLSALLKACVPVPMGLHCYALLADLRSLRECALETGSRASLCEALCYIECLTVSLVCNEYSAPRAKVATHKGRAIMHSIDPEKVELLEATRDGTRAG